ncbi:class I SAM-dependent methyltransferase [Cohnella lubricantis]|uniref:Methyltransferase domain-containing protein n=1 Tax=Cohnella lubricantis TaxID=2163172 RepID=A0A841TGS7_9BACL|nr:class I SAM-dependent methyltransferase [Cohnella lubricantis]MBB6678440.1 methyltransferase domain-containing protein [Cohnella lubricantis]MBP2116820.1 SAM-dependent methyltransferase [Cohnella lubricantis]
MEYLDLLSRLGVPSAHPGGFSATRRAAEKLGPGPLHILEVGCGTGKTACYFAKRGYRVTALDMHPVMLDKARKRAENEGVRDIQWVEGSVEALPFEDGTFDVVYAESVTIFTSVSNSLKEYYRVLAPGGRLMDRELVLFAEMPEPVYKEIRDYFKFDKILSPDEWVEQIRAAGFECERPELDAMRAFENRADPSEFQELELSELFDPEVGQGIMKYADLMLAQEPYFRACDFLAVKPGKF